MTWTAETESAIRAHLKLGPTTASPGVLEAVRREVAASSQSLPIAPTRFGLASAAAVALFGVAMVVVGIVTSVDVVRPETSASSAQPPAPPSAVPDPDSFPRFTPIEEGQRIELADFGEPLTLVVPHFPATGGNPLLVTTYGEGDVAIGATVYAVALLDDQELPADLCRPATGRLQDVPSSPAAFDDWIRWSSSLTVRASGELAGAAGPIPWVTVVGDSDCAESGPIGPGQRRQLFLVPTGDDTLLVVAGSVSGHDTMDRATSELVTSIEFR